MIHIIIALRFKMKCYGQYNSPLPLFSFLFLFFKSNIYFLSSWILYDLYFICYILYSKRGRIWVHKISFPLKSVDIKTECKVLFNVQRGLNFFSNFNKNLAHSWTIRRQQDKDVQLTSYKSSDFILHMRVFSFYTGNWHSILESNKMLI